MRSVASTWPAVSRESSQSRQKLKIMESSQPRQKLKTRSRPGNSNLKILQWNANKSVEATSEIMIKFSKGKIDIAIIQEPHTHNNLPNGWFDKNNTLSAFWPNNEGRPKVCIVSRRSLGLIKLAQFDHQDLVVCRLDAGCGPIILVNIYMNKQQLGGGSGQERDTEMHCRLINRVVGSIPAGCALVFGTDSNCRSTGREDRLTARRGWQLVAWLTEGALHLVNPSDTEYSFRARCGDEAGASKSCVVLTFVNTAAEARLAGWRVGTWSRLSDHCPIAFELDSPPVARSQGRAASSEKAKQTGTCSGADAASCSHAVSPSCEATCSIRTNTPS